MFTTCPNCALNLAVTAADLRVGQGYVRCGRCVSVFNALISLADEAEVGSEEAHIEDTASATQSRPAPTGLEFEEDAPAEDEEVEDEDEGEEEDEPRAESEATPTSTESLAEVTDESRDHATGTFETIVLEGDTILQTEEFVDEAEVDEQLKALALQLEDHEVALAAEETARDDEQNELAAAQEELEAATPRPVPAFVLEPQAAYEVDPLSEPRPPRGPVSRTLLVCVALALLLLLQLVHHWRYPLAARMPWLGAVYSGIGAPLAPQWQLTAYDVRQLGASSDPQDAHRIEVRASVRNGADRPQPAPVLRVILQDRFGNEIGRHERAPGEYLRGAALEMLAADQRVDASFWVDDPEQKAVGFELDACLRAAAGVLRCATDAPR